MTLVLLFIAISWLNKISTLPELIYNKNQMYYGRVSFAGKIIAAGEILTKSCPIYRREN